MVALTSRREHRTEGFGDRPGIACSCSENAMTETNRITADKYPNFVATVHGKFVGAFPEFLNHSEVIGRHWRDLYDLFPQYQFALLDEWKGTAMALGNCFPLAWRQPLTDLPDEGIEWALSTAVAQAGSGETPNLLCAFQIVIDPMMRGRRLSHIAVETMIDIARANGMTSLIAPVRPNRKINYPLMPIDEYTSARRADGLPLDDWLRVHLRLGGKIVGICHHSLTITGSLSDWHKWTGISYSQSGQQMVPGALVPVEFDIENDRGVYIEPNIWVDHQTLPR
jgi:hypothetical protein